MTIRLLRPGLHLALTQDHEQLEDVVGVGLSACAAQAYVGRAACDAATLSVYTGCVCIPCTESTGQEASGTGPASSLVLLWPAKDCRAVPVAMRSHSLCHQSSKISSCSNEKLMLLLSEPS